MSQPYLSLEAELHDAFWDAEDDGSELRLMADFLGKFPGTALEIGAGSGRLTHPLFQLGFQVEGLELSQDMLDLGHRRAVKLGISPTMHLGDMNEWKAAAPYSALLAPAFTLQLSNDPVLTLRHWQTLVKPGGGLYLTVFMPYAELLGDRPENRWYNDHQVRLPDGRMGLLKTRHRLDLKNQRVERQHRYSISGKPPLIYESRQSIRWFEHDQLVALLAECGFHMDRFFLDFDPLYVVENPDNENFDGILTYHATRR